MSFNPHDELVLKLNQMRTIVLSLLFLAAFSTVYAAKVPFIEGGIYKAKETAGREGKLYFVDFYANWCMPCRLMDETTFKDPAVVSYVKKYYVPVKVDVDDFDGVAYKQQYNVKVLPTTLVFNSKGQLLERVEESLSPSRMLKLLKKHNKSYNRKVTITTPIEAPATTKPYEPKPPIVHTSPAKKKKKKITSGGGLYRFDVKHEPASGYSVQIGVFADYANVLQQTAVLKEKYGNKPLLVHIATLGDKLVYRVMLGRFGTKPAAVQFLQKLKSKGGDGVVKTLSELD